MEEKVRELLKKNIIWTVVEAVAILVMQILLVIFAVNVFSDYDGNDFVERIVVVFAIIVMNLLGIKCGINLVCQIRDQKYYKNNDIDKMRGMVQNVHSVTYFGDHIYFYKVIVRDLKTEETIEFSLSEKNIQKEKIYDFWYTKHSKIVKYSLVSDEELTESNREKAGKIDLNRKD